MKKIIGAFALAACLAVGATAEAQDPNYTLSVGGDTNHFVNTSFDLNVLLDSSAGGDIAGWSMGLCHDSTFFEITGQVDGSTTSTVNGGDEPNFNETTVYPGMGGIGGFTVGLVICFTGCNPLPPGTGYELNVVSYEAGADAGSGDVFFCDTLGIPNVATVIVVNGLSISPTLEGVTIEIEEAPDPMFEFIAPNQTENFDPVKGTGAFTAEFSIGEPSDSPGYPNPTQGFSMAVQHASDLLSITGGPDNLLPFDPDFAESQIYADGWTIGVVYSFTGASSIAFEEPTPVLGVDYAISGLVGSDATSTPLMFTETLGNPPVDNVVVVAGLSLDPTFSSGQIDLVPVLDTPFLRGDCNSDLRVDIADGVWILNEMFQSGPAGGCVTACDADNDGSQQIMDAIYVINYYLQSGAPPVAPFPECGTVSDADCAASACP